MIPITTCSNDNSKTVKAFKMDKSKVLRNPGEAGNALKVLALPLRNTKGIAGSATKLQTRSYTFFSRFMYR